MSSLIHNELIFFDYCPYHERTLTLSQPVQKTSPVATYRAQSSSHPILLHHLTSHPASSVTSAFGTLKSWIASSPSITCSLTLSLMALSNSFCMLPLSSFRTCLGHCYLSTQRFKRCVEFRKFRSRNTIYFNLENSLFSASLLRISRKVTLTSFSSCFIPTIPLQTRGSFVQTKNQVRAFRFATFENFSIYGTLKIYVDLIPVLS